MIRSLPNPSKHNLLRLKKDLPRLRSSFAWITNVGPTDFSTCLFRREFSLDQIPDKYEILVSADSRYILWLNGELIGRGPLKGTIQHYNAETYDIASLLQLGRNVLAAEVRWYGKSPPASMLSSTQPGFFVQDLQTTELDTPGNWNVLPELSISPNINTPEHRAFEFLARLDYVDGRKKIKGWQQVEFDSSNWLPALSVGETPKPNKWGLEISHRLVPRDIPSIIENRKAFPRAFVKRNTVSIPWILPAGEGGEIWLDAGELTTSYPELIFEAGAGRKVNIVYAEALGKHHATAEGSEWMKGSPRNDVSQFEPDGYYDSIILPGGDFHFEPFHWRTFWFLKIEILPGETPVSLSHASHRFTTYPQEFSAKFTCSTPKIDKLWENSLRTLRLCAHETYEDCPYFEQLNYAADTRLQILSSFYLANEALLPKRSIRLFRDSLSSSGLTASREPSVYRQEIPAFSLHWILMLGDYWNWHGETERTFIRSCLPAANSILNYFRERLNNRGFIGKISGWAWIDWVDEWEAGVSPAARAGTGSTYLTALFALTLETTSLLHLAVGYPEDAKLWNTLRLCVVTTLQKNAWSESAGYFIEGPDREEDPFTQHTQIITILAGGATPSQIDTIRCKLLDDPNLVRVSIFQRYFLARALEQIGTYDRFFSDVLAPWYEFLESGISTWPETEGQTRSDCHAWSSWMVIDFFQCILGARATTPGWKTIEIRPQVFAAKSAKGEFPTPLGRVRIEWSRDEKSLLEIEIDTPQGVSTKVILPGNTIKSNKTGGHIKLQLTLPPKENTPAIQKR